MKPQLYDVQVAAKILSISPWTVRAAIRSGRLRPVRIGRRVLLEESELERFVAEGKAKGETAQNQDKEKEKQCQTVAMIHQS